MRHYIYITDDYWSKIELHLFFGKNKLSYLQCCHLREKMVHTVCNIWFLIFKSLKVAASIMGGASIYSSQSCDWPCTSQRTDNHSHSHVLQLFFHYTLPAWFLESRNPHWRGTCKLGLFFAHCLNIYVCLCLAPFMALIMITHHTLGSIQYICIPWNSFSILFWQHKGYIETKAQGQSPSGGLGLTVQIYTFSYRNQWFYSRDKPK